MRTRNEKISKIKELAKEEPTLVNDYIDRIKKMLSDGEKLFYAKMNKRQIDMHGKNSKVDWSLYTDEELIQLSAIQEKLGIHRKT